MTTSIAFRVNGRPVEVDVDPMRRLSAVLRDDLGLTGTKVGCDAGDCGACTIRLDGRQVCACLVPAAQAAGSGVRTVEGLAPNGHDGAPLEFGDLGSLQRAFLEAGAAQCGICTPGMLMAADDTLARHEQPTDAQVLDGLGGVLCRCTGYRKIVEAVHVAAGGAIGSGIADVAPAPGAAVGARMPKVDGVARVAGTAAYGADARPAPGEGQMLVVRAIRSPHASARFSIGDLAPLHERHPGLVRVLTAADVPGQNRYGIYETGKDQPALAEGFVRHRGEAVVALVGEAAELERIGDDEVPIAWEPLEPLTDMAVAAGPGAPRLHDHADGNVLIRGRLATGDVDPQLGEHLATAKVDVATTWVEHAYIEPEAGYARRVGDRIEVVVSTQAPYMDRDEVALLLGIRPEDVRIVPTACGGGFGGKLDLGVHPLIAIAAWLTNRPVRAVWTRPESMAASPKRHPARIRATASAAADGTLRAVRFDGDFDTGAYGSWGRTVANRVPVHAMGPYRVPAVLATTRAIHTNNPIAGAFRGFGVPQAAIAHETLMDDLAERLGIDRLELRHRNALRAGDVTPSGQRLAASAGLQACLDALRPAWAREGEAAREWNAAAESRGESRRRGVGVGAMWYGIGNTALANPSTIEMGLDAAGVPTLYCGAVDIGQGASTVMVQIAADALGVPAPTVRLVSGDTDATRDAGKSSASRQTFVSGNAARLAGEDLRRQLLALAEVGEGARLELGAGRATLAEDGGPTSVINLAELPLLRSGDVLLGTGTYDPHTTPLDADGQGIPYETYAFGAQVATVEVDMELGTVTVLGISAAHDVGRAINPTQVEGQIHGGIAQGLGFALMEAYVPGRTENLHDYLIPTVGDIPPIECFLVEDAEPAGPYGAKGVGEPALVPTAPAILGAIRDATGARITSLPATPERVLEAIAGRSPAPS
jgi:CO/xanthine dehydrogenase Mo-binding subunit/aerobic-type carbon monoxide dehydrogenase small subunit (CoxS/CutS family)